MNSCC